MLFGKSKKERPSYGIVGLGRFGAALAAELAAQGAEILVLDRDEEKIREFRELTENALVIKSLDKKTLEETGIQHCDVAVVCIGEHLDTSILTTLTLVSLGIPTVMAKATSAEHGEILEKLGAQVVYPERDMALRLAHRLENSHSLDYVQLSERVTISKLIIPDKMAGQTVVQVNLRGRFGLNIVAIEHEGQVTEAVRPDYTFSARDIIFVVGDKNGLSRLSDWAETN